MSGHTILGAPDPSILGCPFCATTPEVEFNYNDPGQDNPTSVLIACRADECPVAVGVRRPSLDEAIAAWNTRAGKAA